MTSEKDKDDVESLKVTNGAASNIVDTKDEKSAGSSDETKDDSSKTTSEKAASLSETFAFGTRSKKIIYYSIGTVFALVSGLALPAQAYIFAVSFENLSAATDDNDFLKNVEKVVFAFMIIGGSMMFSIAGQTAFYELAATEMTKSFKAQWFEALLRQDMTYFDINDVSGTSSLIASNASIYRRGIGRKLAEGVQFTTTVLGGFGYAFYASWMTTLVIIGFTPLLSIPIHYLTQLNQDKTRRTNEAYSKAASVSYASISSIKTVLSLNAGQAVIDKFKEATQDAYELSSKVAAYEGFLNGVMMGMFLFFNVVLTLFGSWLLYDGVRNVNCDPSGTTGNEACLPSGTDVFGAMFGVLYAASVLPQVTNALSALSKARAACAVACKVIYGNETKDVQYIIDSSSPNGLKPDIKGSISFENVFFNYPTRPDQPVFQNFSLNIPAGTNLALVGESGCGKSSLVALLERFYDVSSGAVKVDGTNIKEINVRHLRESIGLVQQEPVLFAASIRENIIGGYPNVTQKQVEEAAIRANAHDFIMSFPDGYDTQVGNKGAKISGGQKQRIAIARILLRDPKILVLDEATSALDAESESIVQQAINSLLEMNRTTITIAHRLSTIRNADLIAVIEKGDICEIGNHDNLMAKNGAYRRLVDIQTKGAASSEEINLNESTLPLVNPSVNEPAPLNDTNSDQLNNSSVHSAIALDLEGDILFKGLHFSYPTRSESNVFRGLDLAVKKGETLAIVGKSGCGKSTLLSLMERFYDPISGGIFVDGKNINTINVRDWRDQIGFVQQEPVMFDVSIRENISFGSSDISMEQIEEAAKKANAHDFISGFPEGYDTKVGGGGSQLSGGQKQRIAIARAIIKSPRFLLLDEATSALDSESERIIQEALDDVMRNSEQTVLVVAHRLSTVQKATRIAVLEDGKIKEIGSHQELMMKANGRYRKLVEMQLYGPLSAESVLNSEDIEATSPFKPEDSEGKEEVKKVEEEVKDVSNKLNEKRARLLSKPDMNYIFIGVIGALLAGLVFPGWGYIFAFMIELLYKPVYPCDTDEDAALLGYSSCDSYFSDAAEDMEYDSYDITYQWLFIIGIIVIGDTILFYGFGMATERMTKRVRDLLFESVIRQEIAFFDKNDTGALTSQLQEDTTLLHAFSGDPIRTGVMVLSSVFLGLVVSFIYMWPFALLVLGILPFMMFEAEMEMRMYLGEDEGDSDADDKLSKSSAVCVESLVNISTVSSLCLEQKQQNMFVTALHREAPDSLKGPLTHGSMAGAGMLIQNWGIALMFWWGAYLMVEHPNLYDFRDLNISMFALLFGISGFGAAVQGAADRGKAEKAVDRIFAILDRQSSIDPLA